MAGRPVGSALAGCTLSARKGSHASIQAGSSTSLRRPCCRLLTNRGSPQSNSISSSISSSKLFITKPKPKAISTSLSLALCLLILFVSIQLFASNLAESKPNPRLRASGRHHHQTGEQSQQLSEQQNPSTSSNSNPSSSTNQYQSNELLNTNTLSTQTPRQQHNQSLAGQEEPRIMYKRSFAGLGCLGVYDKSKFARLDRVCEECYQLYREPDIHSACRQDCFRNGVFTRCVEALLLTHEQKKFDEMVEELYGK